METTGEFGVLPETAARDVDDVAVMHEAVDQCNGHSFVAEDFAPFFEVLVLVAREDRGRRFVAPAHQLEDEHRAILRDRQIAYLGDDHQARRDERAGARQQAASRLRVLERVQ